MSFIRPEATAFLRQWAVPAALFIGGVAAVGQGWRLVSAGAWTGFVLMAIGVFACLALFGALERALTGWRGRHGGPGVVTVDEGRIAYFGPEGGAVLALDALVSVDIVTTDQGPLAQDLFWVLTDERHQMAAIPGGAKGADQLLDVLGSLVGFSHMQVVAAMGSTSDARFEIWRRDGANVSARLS